MTINWKLLFITITLSTFFTFSTQSEVNKYSNETQMDKSLIDQMVLNGTDVDKIHYVSFMIDCTSEEIVEDINAKAIASGYEAGYISFSENNRLWSTSFAKEMKLNTQEITDNRKPLKALLPSKGCMPITWGSSVEN